MLDELDKLIERLSNVCQEIISIKATIVMIIRDFNLESESK